MITSITFDDISPIYLSISELGRLFELLNQIGVQCTFFVIPCWEVCNSVEQEFSSYLKMASILGHEIALHGYAHIKNEFGYLYPFPLPFIPFPSYKTQKDRLEKAITLLERLACVRPLGFRAPFYLHNDNTLKALSSLGFRYDSSKTIFKPTHGRSFRIRWSHKYKPHKVHGIIEIPVTGDYSYDLRESNLSYLVACAIHDFKWIKSQKGVFIVNIHLNRLDSNLLSRFLRIFIAKTKKLTDFVRLIDIDV